MKIVKWTQRKRDGDIDITLRVGFYELLALAMGEARPTQELANMLAAICDNADEPTHDR